VRISLSKLRNDIVQQFDIYITIIAASVLVIAHFGHIIIEDREIPVATLAVLSLVAVNSLRHRHKLERLHERLDTISLLITQTSEEPGVR
jgi:hypothetical protein